MDTTDARKLKLVAIASKYVSAYPDEVQERMEELGCDEWDAALSLAEDELTEDGE